MTPNSTQISRVIAALGEENRGLTFAEIGNKAFPMFPPPDRVKAVNLALDYLNQRHLLEGPDQDTAQYRLSDRGRQALADARKKTQAQQHAPDTGGAASEPAAGRLEAMTATAEEWRTGLESYCERIEIAGSIRRKKTDPKDIELTALLRTEDDLFGAPRDAGMLADLTRAVRERASLIEKSGPKYIRAEIDAKGVGRTHLDLFMTTDPSVWGMLYFVRTGSADFVRRALSYWQQSTGGGYMRDLRIYDADDNLIETPDEQAVFRALDQAGKNRVPFVPPEKRTPRKDR